MVTVQYFQVRRRAALGQHRDSQATLNRSNLPRQTGAVVHHLVAAALQGPVSSPPQVRL